MRGTVLVRCLIALLLVSCAPQPQVEPAEEILYAVLEEADSRIPDLNSPPVHPQELKMYAPNDPTPGVLPEHFEHREWSDLAQATERAGLELCRVAETGRCEGGLGPGQGYLALTRPEIVNSRATVWVVATETESELDYAATFYRVEAEVGDDGSWTVRSWSVMGSAN